jgi:hypothetical protein
MKTCFKCNKEKENSEFYKHPQMGDGLLGKCKECAKKDIKTNRETSDRPREYDRERSKTTKRKELALKTQRERRKKYPEKNSAYLKVYRAIKKGVLVREACFCGNKAEAHHDDYSKPLDVVWLCKRHHEDRHKQLGWG